MTARRPDVATGTRPVPMVEFEDLLAGSRWASEIEPIFEHFHNRYADAMATITHTEHDPR